MWVCVHAHISQRFYKHHMENIVFVCDIIQPIKRWQTGFIRFMYLKVLCKQSNYGRQTTIRLQGSVTVQHHSNMTVKQNNNITVKHHVKRSINTNIKQEKTEYEKIIKITHFYKPRKYMKDLCCFQNFYLRQKGN